MNLDSSEFNSILISKFLHEYRPPIIHNQQLSVLQNGSVFLLSYNRNTDYEMATEASTFIWSSRHVLKETDNFEWPVSIRLKFIDSQ